MGESSALSLFATHRGKNPAWSRSNLTTGLIFPLWVMLGHGKMFQIPPIEPYYISNGKPETARESSPPACFHPACLPCPASSGMLSCSPFPASLNQVSIWLTEPEPARCYDKAPRRTTFQKERCDFFISSFLSPLQSQGTKIPSPSSSVHIS